MFEAFQGDSLLREAVNVKCRLVPTGWAHTAYEERSKEVQAVATVNKVETVHLDTRVIVVENASGCDRMVTHQLPI
ncbi:hypothetical protein EV644_113178 [Kribbella orskensis]|uniref:Uncharacterized protein n=1 Tax=Kribbella orskensis TaxID=2512216 RepID=A0ABY2BEP5_9ACTN|nr:hypothetical protein EV642_114177 [Kribbella sp. VKM Ac-2500]TCO17948.1 hypothetical protein EV644_113178 [Kribbella orskensis]